ncbi:unnamed protein product [Nezara viridula]|uniref:C2H2-type domain-containing protein n=1 Tax=Nezara viridula TaxID=85310 RepID=A0A9P0HJA7_NEZVI|nr:unnamed protein product [Nezara viridula]
MEEFILTKACSFDLQTTKENEIFKQESIRDLWVCEKCRKEFLDKDSLILHQELHNINENPFPEKEIILRRDLLYKEVRKQQEMEGGRAEVTKKMSYKPRRIYKPMSKRVGLTKIRVEDCLRCDACSCIYIDERDYFKHMRNFHQKYNTIIPRSRIKSPLHHKSCNNSDSQQEQEQSLNNKTTDPLILPIINDAQIREKIKSRWNKVSQSSMPGHAEAVISVKFSPNSKHLASGSGHNNWVLCIAWSPDSTKLVSGCKDGHIVLWDPATGKQKGPTMKGHKQWITSLAWEPYHLNAECRYFASSSKDGDIRIWDAPIGKCLRILTSHSKSVTSLIWGGSSLLYSGSQDRTIKVWRPKDGILCRTLEGHAHWVNSLSVNTDYVMRLGSSFRPSENVNQNDKEALKKAAVERYREVSGSEGEILVSGSDDFTMFMWKPETGKKSFARLTGHQQLINDVKFSPDTRLLASASFDKSIKLWDGKTGK